LEEIDTPMDWERKTALSLFFPSPVKEKGREGCCSFLRDGGKGGKGKAPVELAVDQTSRDTKEKGGGPFCHHA